ncbi:chitobiase/beta-hexosaminidase C-terminal domain-containing protein [Marinilactibacillus kalidii]|uniref:chitobiase/beta-hexosaminidase C-terminal domain-containing protein n=1 Tax=Marinilactibacillus kalidii TaxID=2820274 RepID=UPI001ABDAD4A|nr:chitobiase/beta-hexosaminidase C-terminal domain-containing protein [Marinilactibacillus kalidii]
MIRKWIQTVLSASLIVTTLPVSVVTAASIAPAEEETEQSVNEHTYAESLIFSAYVEGSSNNKAFEIYNGTGQAVDLDGYQVELYPNGAVNPNSTYPLNGILEHGDTLVIVNPRASEALLGYADETHGGITAYNGDDALVLRDNGQIVDVFGQVGERIDWGKDVTLVRNPDILKGDTIATDVFDPSVEWTTYPTDTFDYLGSHVMTGVPIDTTPEEPGETVPEVPENPEEPEETPEVALMSIAEAREKGLNSQVKVSGTVTARLSNTVHLEDETGALAIYPASAIQAGVGQKVTVSGTLGQYNNLVQLQTVEVHDVEDGTELQPATISGADIQANESKLVSFKDVEILSVDGSFATATNYKVKADGQEFILRDEQNTLDIQVGSTYESIAGIVQVYNQTWQVIPRSEQDLLLDSSIAVAPQASIQSGTVASGTPVELTSETADAEIYYTTDGTEPTVEDTRYTEPITLEESLTLKAISIKEGLEASTVASFEYIVYDAETGIKIHDIQGPGHVSPMDGTNVSNVEGIVTYTYEIRGAMYMHIQTPDNLVDNDPNTSEAVVVYLGGKNFAPAVEIGDLVAVTGQVSEYYIDGFDEKATTDLSVTQINARNDRGGSVTTLEQGMELPEALLVDSVPDEVISPEGFELFDPEKYAIDFWESIEAMRVMVEDVRAVSPQEHGDVVTVLDSVEAETVNGGILLKEDDLNAQRIGFRPQPNTQARDFNVLTGDRFEGSLTGVVMYDYGNYKIYTDLADMRAIHQPANHQPQTTFIEPKENHLTVASYNLENFAAATKQTSNEKANRLANAIGNVMKSPDIVGVTEVQDNDGPDAGGPAADQSYQRLVDTIFEVSGTRYEYINIDPLMNQDGGQPNANIQVGFLYNPERVSFVDSIEKGDATSSVGYADGNLTLNPGRIDPTNSALNSSRKPLAAQFEFNGEQVITIINHWNSKRGDDATFGQNHPIQYRSEDQRTQIAEAVAGFVETVKTANPDANIVSMGDFNDFQWTKALEIHEGDYMTNMVNAVPEEERYSYVYQGSSQVLDHILVSNQLVDRTEIDMLKINADFTDESGRASDHDPVMVQIDFSATADPTDPTLPEEPSDNPDEGTPGDEPGDGEEQEDDSEEEEEPAKEKDSFIEHVIKKTNKVIKQVVKTVNKTLNAIQNIFKKGIFGWL